MKYIYTFIIITSILSWLFFLNNTDYIKNLKDKNKINSNKIINEEINKINDNNEKNSEEYIEINKEDSSSKIETIRKRFSVKWIILKWDLYIERSQPTLALRKYLEALKETPDDNKILSKIWDTYIQLWKNDKAFLYYSKAIDYNDDTKNKYIKSLITINSDNLNNSWSIKSIVENIEDVDINNEKKFYYTNSLKCILDFHICKKDFWIYIEENWANIDELIKIKEAIDNYENFQTNNLYYKDSLIIWALFENELYPVVIHLSKEILKSKEWYKPLLLMIWKSYYEIWDYENSKKYLSEYYELEPTDFRVTYLLWILAFNNKEYISSNMYFNSAIKNWYTPKINLERRLIYNYFMLENEKWILDVFTHLLKNEEAQIDDYTLWIYHAINQWKTLTAISWAKKWIELFPEESIFYWYMWRIYREENQNKKALINLIKWLRLNPRNPLVTLNMWYLKESEDKFEDALEYFNTTVSANKEWEFWLLAKKEIKLIEVYLNAIKD